MAKNSNVHEGKRHQKIETSNFSANDIGSNSLLGNRKKIAKCLMRTFTCRSTFLYD